MPDDSVVHAGTKEGFVAARFQTPVSTKEPLLVLIGHHNVKLMARMTEQFSSLLAMLR